MTQVKAGDTVSIHYTGTLADGETFDSSEGREPLEFTVGSGQIIPGLDNAIPGMDQVPPEIPLEIGMQLQMQSPDGQAIPVTVAELSEEEVTLDANHPLAGKDLNFDIEVVEIKAA
jgi:peptidylprolyl isomerase